MRTKQIASIGLNVEGMREVGKQTPVNICTYSGGTTVLIFWECGDNVVFTTFVGGSFPEPLMNAVSFRLGSI